MSGNYGICLLYVGSLVSTSRITSPEGDCVVLQISNVPWWPLMMVQSLFFFLSVTVKDHPNSAAGNAYIKHQLTSSRSNGNDMHILFPPPSICSLNCSPVCNKKVHWLQTPQLYYFFSPKSQQIATRQALNKFPLIFIRFTFSWESSMS